MDKNEAVKKAKTVEGFMYEQELQLLYDLCKDKIVAEIGSWLGKSSFAIASSAKELYCIDVWNDKDYNFIENPGVKKHYAVTREKVTGNMFEKFKENIKDFKNIRILQLPSWEAADKIPDNSLDIVFVDGDHSHGGVKKDIDRFYPKLKNEGMFVFHDYNISSWEGVKKAVDEAEIEKGMIRIKGIKTIESFVVKK